MASWYFNHGPAYLNHGMEYLNHRMEYLNLRRTFGRTTFAASRLLGNLGVFGSPPLLERFGEPVGAAKGPSVVRNGDFSADANGNGLANEWEFTATPKGATFTREVLPGPEGGWAHFIRVPAVVARAKAPKVMIAQHDLPIQVGQWYRLLLRTRSGA